MNNIDIHFDIKDHNEIEQIPGFELGCFYASDNRYEWGRVKTKDSILHFIGFCDNKVPDDYLINHKM
jgi:hypothetical protein